MDPRPTIYIVDDEPAVLAALAAMLEANGYASREFTSAERFLAEVDLAGEGCLITDVQMPGLGGVELQQRLRDENSPLSVVVVSGAVDVPTAVRLMEDGALTLLQKPYAMRDLLSAVQRALVASAARSHDRHESQCVMERYARLSNEERDVLRLMLDGAPNKMIASQLVMSSRTLDRRRHAVLEKMQVESPAQLAQLIAKLPPGTLGAERLAPPLAPRS
jgi:FixJ family two-component response regulator